MSFIRKKNKMAEILNGKIQPNNKSDVTKKIEKKRLKEIKKNEQAGKFCSFSN